MAGEIIQTPDAPAAIGPYVQGRKVGSFIYTSGQIPFDPKTMQLVSEEIEAQTTQSLKNVLAIVEAGGGRLEDIVKTTVFLRDMSHFPRVNQAYTAFFGDHKATRSCVEVARLPKDVYIEIEAIAYVG